MGFSVCRWCVSSGAGVPSARAAIRFMQTFTERVGIPLARLARRAKAVSPSRTLGLNALVSEMKANGIDVVGFGAGEPDYDTPAPIKAAAIDAINKGKTKYTPVSGILELKQAIVAKLREENGLTYKPQEVVVSCGAKHSLYNAIAALVDEGDEVLIPSPYWLTYPEQVALCGGRPVYIRSSLENGFKVSSEDIEAAITPRTKVLIINSPCNPTGAVYSPDELERIARVAVKHGIYVISDEIYEKFIYDATPQVSIASLGDDIKKLTVVVNGVSKTYAMTGWRIGYLACDEEIAKAISNMQSHTTSNPTSIAQWASVQALRGPKDAIMRMVAEFKRRRDYMVERLGRMQGIECPVPEGAFYVFPRVKGLYGHRLGNVEITDSITFAEAFLKEARVAVVPGVDFGDDECVRLSYAVAMERIVEGLNRMEEAISRIS